MRTLHFSHLAAVAGCEVLLGWRLTVRHGVSRSALVWSVGLSALARLLTGPGDPRAGVTLFVALAGMLAAVAAPRLLLGGGARESLRWAALPAMHGASARTVGVVAFALAGATAATLAHGAWPGGGIGLMGAGAVHACLIGALAAGLAPGLGCSGATALLIMLVAVGVGADVEAVAPRLAPPGLALVRLVTGGGVRDLMSLTVWAGLGAAALAIASRRAVRGTLPVGGCHAGL